MNDKQKQQILNLSSMNQNPGSTQSMLKQGYCPYEIPKSSHITPDNPEFHAFPINVAMLTKYGRYVFIRHGNQQRCSSFFATLATIVNKLQLSFGTEQHPANLKKFKQGHLQFYLLRRNNFMYIFWDKAMTAELRLYSMVDFLHYQLMSSLTAKVDKILSDNQTYDPTINFGKGKSIQNLMQFAIENGLYSLPILFNALPSLPLTNQLRSQIHSVLNIKEFKQEGLLLSILMTMNSVVAISKKKSLDMHIRDIFLFFNLLQGQSTLAKSQNWFPICLPGIQPETLVFCYLNYISQDLVHVMISDQSDIFPKLSVINKEVKNKLESMKLVERIKRASKFDLIDDPSLENTHIISHFVIRNNHNHQMVMSKGQYFGDNREFMPEFAPFQNIYAELYQHLLTVKHNRKEKLHIQNYGQYNGGYYEEPGQTIFFIMPGLCDLEEAKILISSVLKLTKQEQASLFMHKY